MPRYRLVLLAFPCLLPLGGCAARKVALERTYGGLGIPLTAGGAERDELTAALAPTSAPTDSGQAPGSVSGAPAGTIRLTIRADGALEYSLKLRNPGRATYVAAHVVKGDDLFAGEPVATLFSGANLRDRQIQVRGTAEMSRVYAPGDLVEQIRQSPILFYVTVETYDASARALRGRFR